MFSITQSNQKNEVGFSHSMLFVQAGVSLFFHITNITHGKEKQHTHTARDTA
jgi:hypothetical protein